MKTKIETQETISIHDFDGKPFRLRLIEPDLANQKKAVITHYLHHSDSGVAKHFKKEAEKAIEEYVLYKNEEEHLSILAEDARQQFLFEVNDIPFPAPKDYKFNFIDLFAGIGGFRLAMQNLGGKCVFTSEWDKGAQKTYMANFGETPFGDITKEETKNFIPDGFDVLCAGFPCQAFSIAGRRAGFEDTRGTLFFEIEKIIEKHRPRFVFLENVKNLQAHDNGRTFNILIDILDKKLGYKTYSAVLNSMTHANIPQNRERIFIVAFDRKRVEIPDQFPFPGRIERTKKIRDIIDSRKQSDIFYYTEKHPYYMELKDKITSKDTVYQWRRMYVRENKNNVCPTLTANMGLGGHNVPLILDDYGIRKLTPRECFSFQGYPKEYILPPCANSKLYTQAGNSVTVPLIQRIAEKILRFL